MPITFDPADKRIILDSTSITAEEIFSRWEDWALLSDNAKYGAVMTHVGGDDLGGGLFIPNYIFLQNGWRVQPMNTDHNLTITGNLFVYGGGIPVMATEDVHQVNVNYTVPVQAQGIATSGSTGPTADQIAAAVLAVLNTTTIPVDTRKMNGHPVIGDGSEGNCWRGEGVSP